MKIKTKRVYEWPEPTDGFRVLVDRLWPRGLSKDDAALDLWAKDVAPSSMLRSWFAHREDRFADFPARYVAELDKNPAVDESSEDASIHCGNSAIRRARPSP